MVQGNVRITRCFLMLVLFTAASALASSVFAETRTHPKGSISVTLPDTWKFEETIAGFHFVHRYHPDVFADLLVTKAQGNKSVRYYAGEPRARKLERHPEVQCGPVTDTTLGGIEAAYYTEHDKTAAGVDIYAVKGDRLVSLFVTARADLFEAIQPDIEFIKQHVQWF